MARNSHVTAAPVCAERREVLRRALGSLVVVAGAPALSGCGSDNSRDPQPLVSSNIADVGPLAATPDANGLRLPEGFSSRIVAKTGQFPSSSSTYSWHGRPDGGAVFATAGGGWIYASNSEQPDGTGGVGALEFDRDGNLIDAFPLLTGTTQNCAGGPTPWGTWLSCEEYDDGQVWECFPESRTDSTAQVRPALGRFWHEAAAVDADSGIVYLTEDREDSCFYRFVPDTAGDLSAGRLQAAVIDGTGPDQVAVEGRVTWIDVPDPEATSETVRSQCQALGAAVFYRGEGAWQHGSVTYFVNTAPANVIWAYEAEDEDSGVLYRVFDKETLFPADASLNGIDNMTVTSGGDLVISEDLAREAPQDLEIQALTNASPAELVPLLTLEGHSIFGFQGELTGPAFDPSGTRLYFSSQRGTEADRAAAGDFVGVTFEVTGPFVRRT